MEYTVPIRRRNADRISDSYWEPWKDFIRDEFLIKDQDLESVVKKLKGVGLEVTKAQLEHKLKQWKLRKNMSAKSWRYVDSTIRKRMEARMESVVILSGRRLNPQRLDIEIKRHKTITWNTSQEAEPPDLNTVSLQICTPRALTPDIVGAKSEWPQSLPWIQFSRSALVELLAGMRLLPRKGGIAIPGTADAETYCLSKFASRDQLSKSELSVVAPAVLFHLTHCTMNIMVGSEELTMSLITSRSIDRMAAHFNKVIPEVYSDDNVQRSAILVNGSHSERQTELLKLLIYLASNNLILDNRSYYQSERNFMKDAEAFVGLFRLSGLAETRMIYKLVSLSYASLTITAVIDLLFKAAVMTDAISIVSTLLKADPRIDPDRQAAVVHRPFKSGAVPSLHYALYRGSIDLTRVMVEAGADIHKVAWGIWPPLAFAAIGFSRRESFQMAQFLLNSGANPNDHVRSGPSILHLALVAANIELVELLLCLGADVTQRCPGLNASRALTDLEWGIRLGVNDLWSGLESIGCYDFAASAGFSKYGLGSVYLNLGYDVESVVIHFIGLLKKCHFGVTTLQQSGASVMIIPAARGHTKVLSCLRDEIGQFVHSINGSLSPIYAAVMRNQVKTCEQLLLWGASAQIDEDLRDIRNDVLPTPLHFAVGNGSNELCRLLINYEAVVNQLSIVSLHKYKHEPHYYFGSYPPIDITHHRLSPVRLAALLHHWKIASDLVESGATATGDDLAEAAKYGQTQLVEKLLHQQIHPDSAIQQGITALEAAISNGHISITTRLLQAGATVKSIPVASIFILQDVSTIRFVLQSLPVSWTCGKGRSYLENAILGGNTDVIGLALAISYNLSEYDSGALCAAVSQESQNPSTANKAIVNEIMTRRTRIGWNEQLMNLSLEATAVSIAAYYRRFDILDKLLSSHGKKIRGNLAVIPEEEFWYTRYHRTGVPALAEAESHLLEEKMEKWNGWYTSPYRGFSPLFLPVKRKDECMINTLLDYGYEVDGLTLKAAVCHELPNSLLEKLIEKCDDLDGRCLGEFSTPLQVAAWCGNRALVEKLLASGADLHTAKGYVGESCSAGNTALISAVRASHIDLVCFLLQRGADVNQRVETKYYGVYTALQVAVSIGYIGVVKQLLDYGANINSRRAPYYSIPGQGTTLEQASYNGRLDIVQLLLDRGVCTEGYDRVQYVRAFLMAEKSGHGAIAQILRNHRPWSVEDENIRAELDEYEIQPGSIFIHPKEFCEADLVEVVRKIRDSLGTRDSPRNWRRWWKGGPSTESILNAILDGEGISEDTDDSMTDSDDGAVELESHSHDAIQVDPTPPAHVNPDGHEALEPCGSDREEAHRLKVAPSAEWLMNPDFIRESKGEIMFHDERACTQGFPQTKDYYPTETSAWERSLVASQDDDDDRRKEILADMMGEKEAPFREVEWVL
ncbi:hypothetical protein BP6252_13271 [Coleophoma cylindrospora]|uniref:Clr5 domain-containing protein n=1 Tax=Coleophoma cylindrospora TaxID=1849047 RepID=A0A3D8QAD0_9HELO|nr:hypothetical protein BP6252_13271 [Coleophoma cylindrospora]